MYFLDMVESGLVFVKKIWVSDCVEMVGSWDSTRWEPPIQEPLGGLAVPPEPSGGTRHLSLGGILVGRK